VGGERGHSAYGSGQPGPTRRRSRTGRLGGGKQSRRADLDADFRADLGDVLDLVALLAARARPG
jgi:hypothetical protein